MLVICSSRENVSRRTPAFSCRERAPRNHERPDLGREAVGWNGGLGGYPCLYKIQTILITEWAIH
jgi:hypothetical protein